MINHTSGNVQRALIDMTVLPQSLKRYIFRAFETKGVVGKDITLMSQEEKNFVVNTITTEIKRIR